METEADDRITAFVRSYDQDRSTQALLIEGDQGTGKTNLLNYYEQQFKDLYPEDKGFYIIRYYADPESSFDKMLAHILRELGAAFVINLAKQIADQSDPERTRIIEVARSSDMRVVLRRLCQVAAQANDVLLNETAEATVEWLVGSRLLKRHRELLGQIHFRLDTVESKTQALRDIVFCSAEVRVLNGLILLLDEIEKVDNTTSKMTIVRFLSAIRALIDALPEYLFLMAAVTPEARRRFFGLLPAIAGRLQNRIELPYLTDEAAALKLYHFYLGDAQERAERKLGKKAPSSAHPVVTEQDARQAFSSCTENARRRGDPAVRQREYLNALHEVAESRLS